MTNQEIDAGFVAISSALDESMADLDFTPITSSKLVLMCAPENELNQLERPITLEDLKTQRFSIFNDEFHDKLFKRLQYQCGPLSLVARVDDAWAMDQVITKLNTVCFGRMFQSNLASTGTFSDYKLIDIGHIIDDHFVLGWITNPNHSISMQGQQLMDEISLELKKNA